MSLPAMIQAEVQQRNDLYSSYQAQVTDYGTLFNLGTEAINNEQYDLAQSIAGEIDARVGMINSTASQIQALDSKLPGEVQTYGDQYKEGIAPVQISDPLAGQSIQGPRLQASPPSPFAGVGFILIVGLAYYFLHKGVLS